MNKKSLTMKKNVPMNLSLSHKEEKYLTVIQSSRRRRSQCKLNLQPKRYSRYATYISKLIEEEPSTFKEAAKHQEWKYARNEEYQSIMKNDIREIVQDQIISRW